MNREPLGLYLLRFMTALALLGFMVMLYWSSVLIEKDMKFVREELTQFRNDLNGLKKRVNVKLQRMSSLPQPKASSRYTLSCTLR